MVETSVIYGITTKPLIVAKEANGKEPHGPILKASPQVRLTK